MYLSSVAEISISKVASKETMNKHIYSHHTSFPLPLLVLTYIYSVDLQLLATCQILSDSFATKLLLLLALPAYILCKKTSKTGVQQSLPCKHIAVFFQNISLFMPDSSPFPQRLSPAFSQQRPFSICPAAQLCCRGTSNCGSKSSYHPAFIVQQNNLLGLPKSTGS